MTTKAILGKPDASAIRLAALPTSTTINPSDVERENLTWRQHNRRLTRKTTGLSQEWNGLGKHLGLSLGYDHLVLPYKRLRRCRRAPESTRGQGSRRRRKPVTPALAVRITDPVWTTQELLSSRVPAALLDKLQGFDPLFQSVKGTRQGSCGALRNF